MKMGTENETDIGTVSETEIKTEEKTGTGTGTGSIRKLRIRKNKSKKQIIEIEKSALRSKKFIAYMVAEFGWKIVFLIMVLQFEISLFSTALMMTALTISGFVQAGYILGQSGVDKYTRIAQINASILNGSVSNDPETKEEKE